MVVISAFQWIPVLSIGIPIIAAWLAGTVTFLYTRVSKGFKDQRQALSKGLGEQNAALNVQIRALDALLSEHHNIMEFVVEGRSALLDLKISTAVLQSKLDEHLKWAAERDRQLSGGK